MSGHPSHYPFLNLTLEQGTHSPGLKIMKKCYQAACAGEQPRTHGPGGRCPPAGVSGVEGRRPWCRQRAGDKASGHTQGPSRGPARTGGPSQLIPGKHSPNPTTRKHLERSGGGSIMQKTGRVFYAAKMEMSLKKRTEGHAVPEQTAALCRRCPLWLHGPAPRPDGLKHSG